MTDNAPQDYLSRLLWGYWHTQTLYVAAKLGIADLLVAGPKSVAELAIATGTNADALYRLLRALAGLGVFAEEGERRFALTAQAQPLRSDVAGSVRALAIMRGEWQYEAWGQLLYSIRTGHSAFEHVFGMPLFDYLEQNPDRGRLFDDAMTGVHGRETEAMLAAYDLGDIKILADVGGGVGGVLTAALRRYPDLQGILFDLPAVAGRTRKNVADAGLADRCRVMAGDFFEAVPAGADAYLLRHILHDWEDDRSLTILRNCRSVLGPDGRLLVVEGIVPPGNEPSISKFFDLAMMVVPGGRERTEEEYGRLLEAAGFQVTRIVPTLTWVSVIEAVPT